MKKTILMTLFGLMIILSTVMAQAKENFVVVVEENLNTIREYSFRPTATDGEELGPFKTIEKDNPKLANMLLGPKFVEWVSIEKNKVTIGYGKAFTSKEADKEIAWVLKRYFKGKNMRIVQYTLDDCMNHEKFQAKLEAAIHGNK